MKDSFKENSRPNSGHCISWDKLINHLPYDATIFSSSGNFGSRVTDCMNVFYGIDKIEAYICDECVIKKADKFVSVKKRKPETKYRYEAEHNFGDE